MSPATVGDRPDFLRSTFDPIGNGFFFSANPPSGVADPANLTHADPWIVVACALARLKLGDFSVFGRLHELLSRHDDADLWNSLCALYSYAAPWSDLARAAHLFPESNLRRYPGLVILYAETFTRSMSVAYVDPILETYRAAPLDDDVHVLVPDYLSDILEDQRGPIAAGPAAKLERGVPEQFADTYWDYSEYVATVRKIRDAVLAEVGSDRVPLLGGRPFHVRLLAQRILKHAAGKEDPTRATFERMAFEANTGISCREFFSDDERSDFRPLSAAAIVEDFLRGDQANAFQPGVRYFFGRPIPP